MVRPVSHMQGVASVQLHLDVVIWDYGPVIIQEKPRNQIFRCNFQTFKL